MKFLCLAGLFLFMASTAFAQPSLYNKCKSVRVQPVLNGAGVFLSEDCENGLRLTAA